jgi:parvulin-like peptidyl-prolyl isomerase
MRFSQFALILFCALCLASWTAVAQQGPAGKASDKATLDAPEPLLGPATPVITMRGLCQNQPPLLHLGETLPPYSDKPADGAKGGSASSDCDTVVTRSQFENLMNAINPASRPEKRRRFAQDYPETVLYAEQARQLNLDKTPEFQELVKYRTLDALAQIYKHYMQEMAAETSDAAVAKFYKEHPERFEQFALKRIFVPKDKLHDEAHPATDVAAEEAQMKKVAEQIRQEIAAGGDFDALQDKAYKAAGDNESALETDLGDKWTRDNLPPGYLKVVETMKPGQVAEPVLFGDGWYIFKLISTRMIPLNEAKPQMESLIINDLAKSLKKSIRPELNSDYFGPGPSGNSGAPQEAQ